MKVCPKCKAKNKDNAKFCDQCGTKFVEPRLLSCPLPGCEFYRRNVLPVDSKFCPSCGTSLIKESQESSITIEVNDYTPIYFGENRISLDKGVHTLNSSFYPFIKSQRFWINGCQDQVIDINLSHYDTTNLDDEYCRELFYGFRNITKIDLSKFSTKDVILMHSMFQGCENLKTIDCTSFNTQNVVNMESMFEDCSSIESLDLSMFNVSKVTRVDSMFAGCSNLREINLSNWKFCESFDSNGIFAGCGNLKKVILNNSDWYTVERMKGELHEYYLENVIIDF